MFNWFYAFLASIPNRPDAVFWYAVGIGLLSGIGAVLLRTDEDEDEN